MRLFFPIILMILSLVSCSITPGGTATSAVSAETKDAMAYCGMGISSSTDVGVGAAIAKNGGKVDLMIKDSLVTEFSKKFSEADALKAAETYIECMDRRTKDKKVSAVQADIDSCRAAWTCDMNAVAGACSCRHVIDESKTKYNWSDRKAAEEYFRVCDLKGMSACWPAGKLAQERSRCETVLGKAQMSLPSLDPKSCKVTPSKSLIL